MQSDGVRSLRDDGLRIGRLEGSGEKRANPSPRICPKRTPHNKNCYIWGIPKKTPQVIIFVEKELLLSHIYCIYLVFIKLNLIYDLKLIYFCLNGG